MDKFDDQFLSLIEERELFTGLHLRWYGSDNVKTIAHYVISDVSQDLLVAWSESVLDILAQNAEAETPFLAAFDLSHRGVGLSYAVRVQYKLPNIGVLPEMREKAEALVDAAKYRQAYVVLVFNNFHSGHLGQLFASRARDYHPKINYNIFFDLNGALNWLRSASQNTQG